MAKSHTFNPKAQFIVRRQFKRNGRMCMPGDLFDTQGIQDNRRLRALYDSGYIWYSWQQEAVSGESKPSTPEAKVEEPKVEVEAKAEEVKEEAKPEAEAKEEVKEEKPAKKKKAPKKEKQEKKDS